MYVASYMYIKTILASYVVVYLYVISNSHNVNLAIATYIAIARLLYAASYVSWTCSYSAMLYTSEYY